MHEALWKRVEAALDGRRSPFEDPALAAALQADPDDAAAVRQLLGTLARLSAGEPRRARHRVRRSVRTLAVAAGLLGLASVAWLARGVVGSAPKKTELAYEPKLTVVVQHSTPAPARVARVELGPRRVLEWTLEGERP